MRIDVFTIFPDLIEDFSSRSLLGRATRNSVIEIRSHDLRAQTTDTHRTVDDSPFGGGPGMVLMPEPVVSAIEAVRPPRPLLHLGPAGRTFDQTVAEELAELDGFSLLCGRYEGIDARVTDHFCDGELSLGDFVLNGGEVAAMAIIEAVCRLVPGVMGNTGSAHEESFADGLLEHPHYTRPAVFRGYEVPEVLRSGDHRRIARWRRARSLIRTLELRPDLIEARGGLREEEIALLSEEYPDRRFS